MKKSEEEKFFTEEKYEDFIEDFEDKWLQYATAEERVKAFFGDVNNAKVLFKRWNEGEDLFAKQKAEAFPMPFRFQYK